MTMIIIIISSQRLEVKLKRLSLFSSIGEGNLRLCKSKHDCYKRVIELPALPVSIGECDCDPNHGPKHLYESGQRLKVKLRDFIYSLVSGEGNLSLRVCKSKHDH